MISPTATRRSISLFAQILTAASVFSAGVLGAKSQQPKKQWPKEPRVTSMPQVFSKVKNLEVVRTWIENPGTPAVSAAVEIRNNSDKSVMARREPQRKIRIQGAA